MRRLRRIAQWVFCYWGLVLHGISLLILLIRLAFGGAQDHEERIWLKNNAGLDFKDHDGRDQTGTRDGWDRIWRDRKRLAHDIKNLPHELYKLRPPKFSARVGGLLIIATMVWVSGAWALAWWWPG